MIAPVCVAIGIWLLLLTGIMCSYGIWWGALLLAPAALHFYPACRMRHAVSSQRGATVAVTAGSERENIRG